MTSSLDETYSLSDIESRTGIPYEKLRYVVDQAILPGDRRTKEISFSGSRGRGAARRYTAYSAFGLAGAALMLAAGLRRGTVMAVLERICACDPGQRGLESAPLYQAFQKRELGWLDIGDQVNWRIRGSADYLNEPLDTGWKQIATGAELKDYEPQVMVSVNTARLSRFFFR